MMMQWLAIGRYDVNGRHDVIGRYDVNGRYDVIGCCDEARASRPIARTYRRGVTWMSDMYVHMHKDARLGGLGACSPRKLFFN